MHLPRPLLPHLYTTHLNRTHPLSPPILILTALTVDALCATRILTALLKRDYIAHKVQPVAGYAELQSCGEDMVRGMMRTKGGEGGVVVCLGLGGGVDLEEVLLGIGVEEDSGNEADGEGHGVEVWVVDARRPWNLRNLFGGVQTMGVRDGRVLPTWRGGKGGVVVWDDGDVEAELGREKEAFFELERMPEIDEADLLGEGAENEDEEEPNSSQSRKRKASDEEDSEASEDDEERSRQRRRSNTGTPIPSSPGGNPVSAQVGSTPPVSSQQHSPAPVIPSSPPKQPSQRRLRRQLLKMRRKHEATLDAYYDLGMSYAEPVSSMLYSLASELGREDNELLWLAIVGISSLDLSPLAQPALSGDKENRRRILNRSEQIREVLRDEVRRLNPIPTAELRRSQGVDSTIPTHARSPTDTGIRLSPEPRFLLIRHWSLYDSMLHSPFLSTRLHVWSENGKKRLNKLLAKMGVSLQEAGKGYVHMDMELKRTLRERILQFADIYNLEGLVPGDDGLSGKQGWGFVRSWGWKATLSAVDVATIVGAILEVGTDASNSGFEIKFDPQGRTPTYNHRMQRALPTPPNSEDGSSQQPADPNAATDIPDWTTARFFAAYDALAPTTASLAQGLAVLQANIPAAQHLARAILRTGSALIAKKQIRHLRAFRMGVVKEGPDVALFTHPGALTKLAAWVGEAVAVLEAEKRGARAGGGGGRKGDEALVLASLDEQRNVYVVVGLGGGGGAGGRKVRSKAEIRARDEKRKRKSADKAAKKADKARKRVERRKARREIQEANGLLADSDEDEEGNSTEESASESESESASSDDESGDEGGKDGGAKHRGHGLNRFGQAFQEVVEESGARVRIDSFEHCVVEVRKEDLSGFLEALSGKGVVG